jgi:hypothetical protein
MGHSGAGYFMRRCATKFPQEVVGAVVVDVGALRIKLHCSNDLQAQLFKVPWSFPRAGRQVHVGHGVTALKAWPCRGLGRDSSDAAEQTVDPAVNLRATATGEPHTLGGGKKRLDLNQTQLLGSKHADHPCSACPL